MSQEIQKYAKRAICLTSQFIANEKEINSSGELNQGKNNYRYVYKY